MLMYEPGYKGPVDRALLRYWSDWMQRKKRYRNTLQVCGHSTKQIDAEIRILRTCIRQVHWLRAAKRGESPTHC